mgnify:CR=1 FL=1
MIIFSTSELPTSYRTTLALARAYLETSNIQAAYDEETAHGVITESQAKWKEKVRLDLKELQDFASTPADCE